MCPFFFTGSSCRQRKAVSWCITPQHHECLGCIIQLRTCVVENQLATACSRDCESKGIKPEMVSGSSTQIMHGPPEFVRTPDPD